MTESLKRLAEEFQHWYGHRLGHSPLYETIIGELITDESVLGLVSEAGSREYIHYLFMAAVHYMLLEGNPHQVGNYYATVTSMPHSVSGVYAHFRNFCFQQKNELLGLMASHQVQINEVRRCTALLPALVWASRGTDGRPLALVDVGAAAGLNLLLDRFSYDYGPAGSVGDPVSGLRLTCEPRGPVLPPVPAAMLRVNWRVGIDCQPVDVADSHATNWLTALVAPDDNKRLTVLRSAIEIARKDPPEVIAGPACDALPDVLASVPLDLTLCVFHCFTTHHFTRQELDRFNHILMDFGRTRDFSIVSLEWDGKPNPQKNVPLEMTSFVQGKRADVSLGLVDWRGGCEWIEWGWQLNWRPDPSKR